MQRWGGKREEMELLRLGAQTTIQRVSLSLSVSLSLLSLLLSLSLSRPPRSVWVPMQNRRPSLPLLAEPLDRPPKKSVADVTPQKSVWLLSVPYLPMRGLYRDATPAVPMQNRVYNVSLLPKLL